MPTYVFFDYDKNKINVYEKILSKNKNHNFIFLNCDLEQILEKFYTNSKFPFILVSPANSYGDMTGGIDRDIIKHFPVCKQGVLDIVNTTGIRDSSGRKHIPVGDCRFVKLDSKYNALIMAPTMETPKNIVGTPNVYLAFKSIYFNTQQFASSVIIAIPCLGTGIGGLSGEESALQIMKFLDKLN